MRRAARSIARIVENAIDVIFERLPQRVSGRRLELVVVRALDDVDDILLCALDRLLNVAIRRLIGDRVADADCVSLGEKPGIDEDLNVRVEVRGDRVAELERHNVKQILRRPADCTRADDAADELASLDEHFGVARREPLVRAAVLVVRMCDVICEAVDRA